MSARRSTNDVARCISALPTEDVVVLHAETPWAVPWELLMLGPFARCALADTDGFRLVTATAMLRSAVRGTSAPDALLCPLDYEPLLTLSPETSLFDAARSVVEVGWEIAMVSGADPQLIAAQSVFRALLAPSSAVPAAEMARSSTRSESSSWLLS